MSVNFIGTLRTEQGNLKDTTFARTLGINKTTLIAWYDGVRLPTERMVRKVCKALGYSNTKTSKFVNHIEAKRERQRMNDPKVKEAIKAKKEAEVKASMELTSKFVESGRRRGMNQSQLLSYTGLFSRVTLNKYLKGTRRPDDLTQRQMREFIGDTTLDGMFVEVPDERPNDYSLLAEQVYRIGRVMGLTQVETCLDMGGVAPSSFVRWKKGETPLYNGVMAMIEYIEDYNYSLPKSNQIDPYGLMPDIKMPIRIRIEDYSKLRKLEDEYGGSLSDCPADHPMLLEIRNDWGIWENN